MHDKDKGINPLAINILRLKQYNFKFFSLEEVVFFEYLVVKAKAFKFKEFFHSAATILSETGIKRTRLDRIIIKFESLGILSVTKKGFPVVMHFTVYFDAILPLVSKIYQFVETDKLSVENSKLYADYYKLLVETDKQKELNKEHKEGTVISNLEKKKKGSDKLAHARFNYSLSEVNNFIDLLESEYNNRRQQKKEGKYPPVHLPYKANIAQKAQQAMNEMGVNVIKDAWMVFCDQCIDGQHRNTRLLPYFFSNKSGPFDIIGVCADIHNTSYTYTKSQK